MTAEEILQMLRHPPDLCGECDGCQQMRPVTLGGELQWFGVPLWTDQTEPGEFAYCFRCWVKIARKRRQKENCVSA